MIYLDVRRPSDHLPTVELRICDACPRLDDVVLLAGLFRALVIRETGAALAGRPPPAVRPELLYGLEGNLVGPVTATPVPAHQLIGQLLSELRPALDAAGDRELGARLADRPWPGAARRHGSAPRTPAAACRRSPTYCWQKPGPARLAARRGSRSHDDQRAAAGPRRHGAKRSASTTAPADRSE